MKVLEAFATLAIHNQVLTCEFGVLVLVQHGDNRVYLLTCPITRTLAAPSSCTLGPRHHRSDEMRRSASPVARARRPANASREHTILITGATGYGGRWLVKCALDAGFRVRAADLRSPAMSDHIYDAPLDARAEFVKCDVTSDADVAAAVSGVQCKCCWRRCHLIAPSATCPPEQAVAFPGTH